MIRRQDYIDTVISAALGIALILSGCAAIVLVVAVVNELISLAGHLA